MKPPLHITRAPVNPVVEYVAKPKRRAKPSTRCADCGCHQSYHEGGVGACVAFAGIPCPDACEHFREEVRR